MKLRLFLFLTPSLVFAGPQEDFIAAVKRDNLKQAQKIFDKGGVDVNAPDAKGKAAVLHACDAGSVTIFQYLAEKAADLNAKDADGNGCIHLAVKARKAAPMIAAAIEKGLDKNAGNTQGLQPIIIAYDGNHFAAFEALVKAGAEAGVTHPKSGMPLLFETIVRQRLQYAKFLIEAGVNLGVTDNEGNSPIVVATKQSVPDLIAPLISKGQSIDARDSSGRPLIQIAHENILKRYSVAREKLFTVLLEAGANANAPPASARSMLMEQSESGRAGQVKILIAKGADVNFRDKTGNTVLHTTAQRNQLATMRLVVEQFPDINLTGDSGNTAAHFAARAGGTGILQLLKGKGANFELKNNAGETPLSIAIGRQDPGTTRALLGLGATLSDEGRETPLMLEVAKSGTVNARTGELLGVMKKGGANLNAVNRYGNSALAYALSRKNLKMADALLKAGADITVKDARGNTLLHKLVLSARYNRMRNQELRDWAELILAYQHSDHQNATGETALHIAASSENNPDTEAAFQIFEHLVNVGAAVTVRDARGRSAYDLGRKMDWDVVAGANQPGPAPQPGLQQVFATAEPDRLVRITTADRDFYAAHISGTRSTIVRFSDELGARTVKEFIEVQAIQAAGDGVLVAGVRPGDIDGAPDKKCREGKNLVVYVALLDSSLNPRWENTWGKPGSCQRSAALAVGQDPSGRVLLYAEFSGRKLIRRLTSPGAFEEKEFVRNDRITEFSFLPDGHVALTGSQNLAYDFEAGKNLGVVSRARGIRYLALAQEGVRYFASDYMKLSGRRGIALSAEDTEGKIVWTKYFASEKNMTVESIVTAGETVCMAGKADGALHGQAHSTPGKPTDYYVLCADKHGARTFTRLLPAANLTLADMKLNRRGVIALAFRTADKKNPDVVLYRIDREGRIFN